MTTLLKGGGYTEDPRLDRVVSPTFEHIDKYPLTLATATAAKSSMVAGINWYSNFDHPVVRRIAGRNYWVVGEGDLGALRGGHAICMRHYQVRDSAAWWDYYNQGQEGRCVEFACLRCMTHNNRRRYDITSRWHYRQMQRLDYWDGESPTYEGTSVDAGLNVMRLHGAIPALPRGAALSIDLAEKRVNAADGIQVFRWATSWDDVRTALDVPDWMPGVPFNNSWGRGYPHQTIMMDAAGERVLREDGELGVVTDR